MYNYPLSDTPGFVDPDNVQDAQKQETKRALICAKFSQKVLAFFLGACYSIIAEGHRGKPLEPEASTLKNKISGNKERMF